MLPDVTSSSYSHNYKNADGAVITINDSELNLITDNIKVKGGLTIAEKNSDITLLRSFYPAFDYPALIEHINIKNNSENNINLKVKNPDYCFTADKKDCKYGIYISSVKIADEKGNFDSNKDFTHQPHCLPQHDRSGHTWHAFLCRPARRRPRCIP
jgi:hypothetical protein